MSTRIHSSTRMRVLSLAAVFMVVVSACRVEPGDPGGGCNCPNLEATATSIDWVGDGTVPDEIRSSFQDRFQGDPAEMRVAVFYNTPDRIDVQIQVEERLREAGFDVTDPTPFSGRIDEEEWSMSVLTAGNEENPQVAVIVRLVDDDARAAEILAPLVDALGTLP